MPEIDGPTRLTDRLILRRWRDEDRAPFEIADVRETPEDSVLRREGEAEAETFVEGFLSDLSKAVRGKVKQYDRIVSVLWYCYLISDGGTQLEIAEMLGVSDSLVSDYRKRIESNLQALSFEGVNEARHFEKALKKRVRVMVADQKEVVAV